MKANNAKKALSLLLVLLLIILTVPFALPTVGAADIVDTYCAAVRYADKQGNTTGAESTGLRFFVKADKSSSIYKENYKATYAYDSKNKLQFGMVLCLKSDLGSGTLTVNTAKAVNIPFTVAYSQDTSSVTFVGTFLNIPAAKLEEQYAARAYVKVTENGSTKYTYESDTVYCSAVEVANNLYKNEKNADVLSRLEIIFSDCQSFLGYKPKSDKISFTVFSDLHYKEGMYISSVADMETILDRADKNNSEFIVQLGDFSNDYYGSVEITDAYLNNKYTLPAYGVYGNHELETNPNSMAIVTPLLNNRNVTWGTADGKIGNGSIGYYYTDLGDGFRMIALDTNYSWNPNKSVWEHNYTASYGYPSGNQKGNSLGPTQLSWLQKVLNDAVKNNLKCIIVSHVSFSGKWDSSPDAPTVRAMFKAANDTKKGTVMLALNGHLHTDRAEVVDGILYVDVNTVRNGVWKANQSTHHYTTQTYKFVSYDVLGKVTGSYDRKLNSLYQSMNTWYFQDPLSANITISQDGKIKIDGMTTSWYGGVTTTLTTGQRPAITTAEYDLW